MSTDPQGPSWGTNRPGWPGARGFAGHGTFCAKRGKSWSPHVQDSSASKGQKGTFHVLLGIAAPPLTVLT